jgi:hypothetical protein
MCPVSLELRRLHVNLLIKKQRRKVHAMLQIRIYTQFSYNNPDLV